jgi:hypothetical protein
MPRADNIRIAPSSAEPEIALSATPLVSALFDPTESSVASDADAGGGQGVGTQPSAIAQNRAFKIRGANSAGQRSSANVLIRQRYAWRGYGAPSLAQAQRSDRFTLTATHHDALIGTITVGLDGGEPLQAEDTFAPEIEALRTAGSRLCEFTKLAVDTQASSRQVLASLFHVAFLLGHRIHGCDTLVMELNPRHVGYYRRLLGCTVLGAERTNQRVNAPAVLLKLDLHYAREQIALLGGRSGQPLDGQRTIYPLFFSAPEEVGIIGRLQRVSW